MRRTGPDWRPRAQALADRLAAEGTLRDPTWRRIFATAPRHEFLEPEPGESPDSASLLRRGYEDDVVLAALEPDSSGRLVPVSSLSQPTVTAELLQLLDPRPGQRTLEIGLGPGYNAYLLCRRIGAENVCSLDLRPDLVRMARRRLRRLGQLPKLTTGDGARGWPEEAPFDRIVATCALGRVPPDWLPQLAPRARVVAPMSFGGAVAVLERDEAGALSGRFAPQGAYYLPMRTPGAPLCGSSFDVVGGGPQTVRTVDGRLDDCVDADFRLWAGLFVPALELRAARDLAGRTSWLRAAVPGAEVEAIQRESNRVELRESGAELWPQLRRSLRQWRERGRPGRARLGLTATPERQWVWLDSPDGVSREL